MMKLYTVVVPYTYSDCCYSDDREITLEVYAKSEQHARHRAKRITEEFPCVWKTHSTEIVEVSE